MFYLDNFLGKKVLKSDLILDFSGEMWSSIHADLVGKDRFLVGVLKDRTAQLLGKKDNAYLSDKALDVISQLDAGKTVKQALEDNTKLKDYQGYKTR